MHKEILPHKLKGKKKKEEKKANYDSTHTVIPAMGRGRQKVQTLRGVQVPG